jgi:hypothetical protein
MKAHYSLIAAVALLASSCIDDPSLLSDDPIPITPQEAEILGLSVWRAGVEAQIEANETVVEETLAARAPAAAPEQFAEEVSVTAECAAGGTIDATVGLFGTIDEEASTGDLTFSIQLIPHACGVERENFSATLYGWPDLTFLLRLVADAEGDIDISGSLDGGIRFSRDGGDTYGFCFAEVVFDGESTPEGHTEYTISGTMCGAPVDETVVIEAASATS